MKSQEVRDLWNSQVSEAWTSKVELEPLTQLPYPAVQLMFDAQLSLSYDENFKAALFTFPGRKDFEGTPEQIIEALRTQCSDLLYPEQKA